MADMRKWTLFIGAMVAAGITASGCSDDDAVFVPGGNPKGAPDVCKNVDTCGTSDQCIEGDGAAACQCVTNLNYCHEHSECNGVGSCSYKCGEGDSCSYKACKSDDACKGGGGGGGEQQGECDVKKLRAQDDFDKDGITNGNEINSSFEVNGQTKTIDPCNADSDGDTIPDGNEDLNHNGKYEPWLGETNPADSSDPGDADTEEGKARLAVKLAVCNDEMLANDGIALKSFRIAPVKGVDYKTSQELSDYVAFVDTTNKVAGAFFARTNKVSPDSLLTKSFEGTDLLDGQPASDSKYYGLKVPADTWLTNGIYAVAPGETTHDFDRYQVVPNHTVDRFIYHLSLKEGAKITEIRDKILMQYGGATSVDQAELGSCDNGKALVYIARSTYPLSEEDDVYLYSIAMACENDASATAAKNLMTDVQSGTLVAGGTTLYPYRDYQCQQEKYGSASGSVDFIWVVDNSGSMADELLNLSKTVKLFMENLKSSGINYRLGVTTTDSYTLDEWPTGYMANEMILSQGGSTGYLEPTGLINGAGQPDIRKGVCMYVPSDGFSGVELTINRRAQCVKSDVKDEEGNLLPPITNSNICGYGIEDGFKSGAEVLNRLASADGDVYDHKKSFACGAADSCVNLERCMLRDDALKYFIFVSDEETRQFKEDVGVTEGTSHKFYKDSRDNSLKICKTGYKLTITDEGDGNILNIAYNIMTGAPTGDGVTDATAADLCNPAIKSADLVAAGTLKEEMSIEDIKKANADYYNVLIYYMQQYKKFAGKGGVAAFALVGDDGTSCKPLGNNPGDTVGANFGIGYIHFARFLSALDDGGEFSGKNGGSGSICNTSYQMTIDSIFEDVRGRIASHPLRGYPISSTIRVAVYHDNDVIVLKRGEKKNGWDYDSSQNAIVFTGVNFTDTDEIAISYVVWSVDAG